MLFLQVIMTNIIMTFFSAEIVVLAENFLKGRLVKRQFSTTLTFWNYLKFIQWFKPVSVHMHNWFVIMAFAHLHWIGNQKGLFLNCI